MSTLVAAEIGWRYEQHERAAAAASPLRPLPQWMRGARSGRWRALIECAAGIVAGAVIALGCAALTPADSNMIGRRERLEQEVASLSAPLAEYARLERAGHGAHASAVAAAARARPSVELRSLLETLSREAQAGVTVRHLRQSRGGFEIAIRAVDSAACAAWVARLARVSGWEGTEILDLRLVAASKGQPAGRAVEANVRVPSRASASASELDSGKARAVHEKSGEPGERRGR